jgi:hypothetical protein
MPILAGFHVEGNDHLILHAFVAKVLLLPEEEILRFGGYPRNLSRSPIVPIRCWLRQA